MRTQKARDKVCPGCGGRGGRHRSLDCSYLRDDLRRRGGAWARRRRKGQGGGA